MNNLRRWVLAAAVALVAVIVALLLYGEHQKRRLLRELPARLGAEIQQQSNEFTYSQSYQGQTLFTLHAAKAVQMKEGGHVRLHDVSITLYGRKQDRADRIAGQEFEYDPQAGVARAVGDVFLDLQAPAKAVATAQHITAQQDAERDLGANGGFVHVVTRGLVFEQKQGKALTDQGIEFRLGSGLKGRAVGAEYDSGAGILTLKSAVTADSVERGRGVHMEAARGVLERDSGLCRLEQASYSGGGETARAGMAVVKMRTDGSAERVELTDNVTLTMASGGVLTAPRAVAALSAASEPQRVDVLGGVHYTESRGSNTSKTQGGEARGEAASAHISFDSQGDARVLELAGGVHVVEREAAKKGASGWKESELAAERVTSELGGAVGGTPELRRTTAVGGARLRTVDGTGQSTVLKGDRIAAEFAPGAGAGMKTPRTVHGEGNVVMVQTAADGTVTQSQGNVMDAVMQAGRTGIEQAVLTGGVRVVQTSAKSKNQKPVTATGERAVYTGAEDALVITGAPHLEGNAMSLTANTIRVVRGTGDAVLTGDVRGNYTAGEASHVVAEKAVMSRKTETVVFTGGAGPARMWQGGSQVEANQLVMEREGQRLTATGGTVSAVFAADSTVKSAAVLRLTGGKMAYSGGQSVERSAVFDGGVTVLGVDGTVKARRATVYLTAAAGGGSGGGAGAVTAGSVERIVAVGGVEMESGGRRGRGEKLVYTPSAAAAGAKQSGEFELTGTKEKPPVLMDGERGSVTGSALKFNSADDTVIISGGAAVAGGAAQSEERARTRMKVER